MGLNNIRTFVSQVNFCPSFCTLHPFQFLASFLMLLHQQSESTFLDEEKYLRKSGKVPANQEYAIEYLVFALFCIINVVEDT